MFSHHFCVAMDGRGKWQPETSNGDLREQMDLLMSLCEWALEEDACPEMARD